ncbi:MAG TPA: carboxymuconolactone decarboxylase family protein [Casimicrobiaceae bacterium]|jgi:4-carboxymuconolactone decarboxylase
MVDRLPPLPDDALTPAQREAAAAVIAGPRGGLYGPFVPLLRSPELLGHAQRLGEYLRYRSAIGTQLSELAILMVARHWSQDVEWAIHAPIAAQAGIAADTIAAIGARATPPRLTADEAIVHAFCTELQATQRVSDATFERARARFGEHGVVDLLGLCGYYTLLAMVMNGAQTALPPNAPRPPWAEP